MAVSPNVQNVDQYHIVHVSFETQYRPRPRKLLDPYSQLLVNMLFKCLAVFAAAISVTLAQTIELGFPQNGDNFTPGQEVVAQVILPQSIESCIQVGIALAIDNCANGSCPNPADVLGSVLYAGPWTPESHPPGGFYQNFTVTIPSYLATGPAIFTLTHLCLLGAGPYPFLEYRNATVNIL
jgi:hypothetical protein